MYGNEKDNVFTVYMHVFPNGKVYVGITSKTPEERWLKDGRGYYNQIRMFRAIKKYGWNNIEHIIIATKLTLDCAVKMETNLIELYDSTNKEHGYNADIGGHTPSEEVKNKISKARTGQHVSEEARKKMSEQRKGVPKREEHKRKIAEANTGHKHSDETKQKIREKALGRKQDTDHDPRNIPVLQFDILTGKFINRYLSISKAGRETGLSKSHISECAKDKRRQEGGFIWLYESDASIEYIQYRLERVNNQIIT